MSEKLLTLKEACEILALEPDEMLRLVDEGKMPCFRIGGEYIRFKRSQIEIFDIKSGSLKPRAPASFFADIPYSGIDWIKDLWRFNDVYIISSIIIITLLFLMFK